MSVFDKFSGIGVASGFKLQAKAPIDPRQVVDTVDDRNALITENGAYEGIQVYVKADKKTYVLKDLTTGTWEELGAGGGGSSVQADYNQNDSTAADYIKNRPFYDEAPTVETILDQTFSTITASGVNFWATNASVIQLTKGDTVKVVYNGIEYTQEVKDLNAVLYVGNIGLGGLSPVTDEPFLVANIYYPDGLSKLTPGTTIATSEAQTNATIKITKEIENVKTINPKYIKDMYYENVVETELYNGTLTNTYNSSSQVYTADLLLPTVWAVDGDSIKVVIDGVEKTLPVVTFGVYIQAGSVSNYDVEIITNSSGTKINTKTQYTNATLVVTNIHDDTHKVPSKYIDITEHIIELTTSSIASSDIEAALTTYFNNNKEELITIQKVMSLQLRLTVGASIFKYAMQRNRTSPLGALRFVSIYGGDYNFFDTSFIIGCTMLEINIVNETIEDIVWRNLFLLDNRGTWEFKVITDGSNNNDKGLLGIAHLNQDTSVYDFFIGSVKLHDWITVAQQRSDFQIPVPTKETDLVDKKYADSLVSGGSSLSIELAVGASETTDTVFKTYLNNNASVLTQLEAASSFTLKVVKTTSVTTLTATYTFAKNYTNTFTGAQYHFVCVYGTGETTVEGTVLWFSVSDSAVSDLKLTTYDFARITYNHCISITDGSTYSLKFIFPSKSATLVTTQAQLTTLIGNSELPASGWALVDSVYYTIGFIKNNSYCYYGNAKEPTWHSLGEYTITDTLL